MARPRIVVARLVVLAVIALLTASACAGSSPDSLQAQLGPTPASVEAQWPRGGTSGIPGVKGVIELLLFNRGAGETMFRAMGRAEGDGLVDNALYSLWLTDQKGRVFLIDSGRADEECEVDPDTGEDTDDCELEVHLRSQGQPAPFPITSLVGLTATIREGGDSIGLLERAPIVVSFTVTEADL